MIPFPNKKYQIIYADPPWKYKNKRTGGSLKSGAESKYSTMTVKDISNLPVQEISCKDSVLFLWVTCPMQKEGMLVMESWGYRYKTKIYWRKIMSLGMGFWFRGQVEECWFGIKGNIKAFRMQIPNFIQTKALRHSEKPEEVRKIIENTGLCPCIELFARQKTEGWDAWGNEIINETGTKVYENSRLTMSMKK